MVFIQKNRSVIYAIIVALLFATYPLSMAANSITMGLLIGFYILDSKQNLILKLKVAFRNKFVWLSIAYVVAQIIGLLYSKNLVFGIKQVNHALPFLILPIIALSENVNKKNILILKEFVKYWTVAVMLFFIIYHVFVVKRTMDTIVDFTINYISSTSQLYPSALILIVIIISLNQIIKSQKKKLNLIILSFAIYCLLLLSSRIAILTFIILLVYLVITMPYKLTVFKRVLMLLATLSVLSISIYNVPRIKQKLEVFYKTTDFNMEVIRTKNSITFTKNTLEHRILIYDVSIKAIAKNWLLGYGTGDYQMALNKGYNAINFKAGKSQEFNTHNQFLEELLKTGVLGGIIFLLLFLELLKFCNIKDYVITCMIVLVFISCLFESFLSRYHGVIFMAFFIPFFAKNELDNKNTQELK